MRMVSVITGLTTAFVLSSAPAFACGCIPWGGGHGAPGPEAAVGLPFLALAGAFVAMRRRRTVR